MAGPGPAIARDGLVLVTRPQPDADLFAMALNEAGMAPLVCPLIHINFDRTPSLPKGITGWALTSANGARALGQLDVIDRTLPAWCVGPATAAAARAAGLSVAGVADSSVESLAALIAAAGPGGKVCHVTGSHRAGNLVAALGEGGISAIAVQAYDAVAADALPERAAAAIASGRAGQVVLFSPRTATLFRQHVVNAGLDRETACLRLVCLSPAVAEALQGSAGETSGWNVVVAPVSSASAVIDIVTAGLT